MKPDYQVGIIGGGITGLALGYKLQHAGVPHVILEATGRPGGVIRSGRVDGRLLEWGPQRTRLTAPIRKLIDQLDIADQVITAEPGLPLFVYRSGKLRRVPFNARDFLLSDIVPFSAKLRLAIEPLTAGASDDEAVADYFIRKVGRPLYENLLGPLYGGLYASDPADMVVGLSLGKVLEEFRIGRSLVLPLIRRGGSIDPPPACSFRDGLSTLPRALAAELEGLRLDTPVMRITGGRGAWALETEGGRVTAEELVLTVPAPVAADLLGGVHPGISRRLHLLTYNPLAVVHLHAETDLAGLGYQVSLAESLATRGVTFNASMFDRDGVYTAYLGGAKAPGVVAWGDAELGHVAAREFETVTGYPARPIAVEREMMPAWDKSWAAIRDLQSPEGLHFAANWQSRPGIPGRLAQAGQLAAELAEKAGAVV